MKDNIQKEIPERRVEIECKQCGGKMKINNSSTYSGCLCALLFIGGLVFLPFFGIGIILVLIAIWMNFSKKSYWICQKCGYNYEIKMAAGRRGMKWLLLFILPILIMVSIAFVRFGVIHVRFEEEKLLDDHKRKAKAVAESVELAARNILVTNDLRMAKRLVESFQKRERMQGCVIYDSEGKVLAITERISKWQQKARPYIKNILSTKEPHSGLEKFREYSVYSYALPVLDEKGNLLGAVEVIYNVGDNGVNIRN
jgi:hypothetical protein